MKNRQWMAMLMLLLAALGLALGLEGAAMAQEKTRPPQVLLRLYSDNDAQEAFILGDTLTLEVSAAEELPVLEGSIAGKAVDFEEAIEEGLYFYRASLKAEAEDFVEGERVTAQVKLGEGEDAETLEVQGPVFYAPLALETLDWTTDNKNPEYIKNGEYLKLSFKTSHQAQAQVLAAGQAVSVESEDGLSFGGGILADNLVADQTTIDCSLTLTDPYGNPPLSVDLKTATYLAPLTLTQLCQRSDNSEDPAQFLKAGDHFFLEGALNHPAALRLTAGEEAVAETSAEYSFELGLPVEALKLRDQESPAFELSLWDAAGNTLSGIDGGQCENQLRYYAPIEAYARHDAQDYVTQGYIKNGMTLNTEIFANHQVAVTTVSYGPRPAEISENSEGQVTARLSIAAGETLLPEGSLSFEARLEDPAGNIFWISEDTGWIYDRTPPVGRMVPDQPGFFNSDLNFKLYFQDENLETSGIRLAVNGRAAALSLQKDPAGIAGAFALDKEGSYTCEALAVDKAGNTSETCSLRVIIDKTSPKITLIDLKTEEAPVYKAGFVLSEHFQIQETYLKSVECTLTDLWGFGRTRLWSVDQPIVEDGLKTAEIFSVDMAENRSEKIRCQFYIDGTPPAVLIRDKKTGRLLENGEGIAAGTTLEISLDKKWIGSELPDYMTQIEGYVCGRALEMTWDSPRRAPVTIETGGQGEVALNITAADEVGNVSETQLVFPTLSPEAGAAADSFSENLEPEETVSRVPEIFLTAVVAAALCAAAGILWRKYADSKRRRQG
ncbi:MAG: hypothetical protein Q4C55_03965 [Eubacterium sp.]|nr:hypothetical protein [Eubacterium sp.]